jgi:hypothetical protein
MIDLTNQQILDAIGWAFLPGSAVRRIEPLEAVARAAEPKTGSQPTARV